MPAAQPSPPPSSSGVRRRPGLAISYSLALAAGIGISPLLPRRTAEPATSSAGLMAPSGMQSPQASHASRLDDLLREIQPPPEPDFRTAGYRLAMILPLPSDPAEALEPLIAQLVELAKKDQESETRPPSRMATDLTVKIFALMWLWLDARPAEFAPWADHRDRYFAVRDIVAAVVGERAVRLGPQNVIALWNPGGTRLHGLDELVTATLKSHPELRTQALAKVTPENDHSGLYLIAGAWPVSDRPALVRLAIETNCPSLLSANCQGLPGEGAWLLGIANDPALPEDFRKELMEDAGEKCLSDPLADPAARMAAADHSLDRNEWGRREKLCESDVSAALDEPVDLACRFRLGEMTATEVMAEVAARSPGMAAAEPDALRYEVFRQLVRQSPATAMELLAGLPEEQRYRFQVRAAWLGLKGAAPELFFQMMKEIPADTAERRAERRDLWLRRADQGAGEEFHRAVLRLPAGLDRDLGISAAMLCPSADPAQVREWSQQIADTELRALAEKAQP